LVHIKTRINFQVTSLHKGNKLESISKVFSAKSVCINQTRLPPMLCLSQCHIISSKLFGLFKMKTEFNVFAQRRVLCYSQSLPLNQKKTFTVCTSGWNTQHASSQS